MNPPRDTLRALLADPLSRWVRVPQTLAYGAAGETQLERALASLELLDSALARLGDRRGVREDAARSFLQNHRETIGKVVALVESLGARLDQPRAVELLSTIERVHTAHAQAQHAVNEATHDTIADALLALEHAKISSRDLDREVASVIAGLRVFPLPDATAFARAESETEALEKLPAKRPKPSQLAKAILAGFEAAPDLAKLFVIYERDASHSLLAARGSGIAERSGG